MGWRDYIIWVLLAWNSFFLMEEGFSLATQHLFHWIGRWDFQLATLCSLWNQPNTEKKGFTLLIWLIDHDYEIDLQFYNRGKEEYVWDPWEYLQYLSVLLYLIVKINDRISKKKKGGLLRAHFLQNDSLVILPTKIFTSWYFFPKSKGIEKAYRRKK